MTEPVRVSGEIAYYIAALGHAEKDAPAAAILASLPGPVKRIRANGLRRVYLEYREAGVTIILERAVVSAVLLTLVAQDGFVPYPLLDGLIDGIDFSTAYKTEVRAVLGDPVATQEYQDNLDVAGAHIVVGYDTDDVWDVQILATSPSLAE